MDICMFGMSDDERSDPSEEDADEQEIDSHVVAATLQESGAGAFIAACPLQSEQLGFAVGLSLEGGASSKAAASSAVNASVGSEAPGPDRTLSPLIAQLNPFLTPPPLSLPEAENDVAYDASKPSSHRGADAEAAEAQAATAAASAGVITSSRCAGIAVEAGEDSEISVDAQRLLVEMGELVFKLQQRRELSLATQEVGTEELLARLEHFREVDREFTENHLGRA